MRSLLLIMLVMLPAALASAAEGYDIDIDETQSKLVIRVLNRDRTGAMDGSFHCWVNPGLVDGAEAVISNFDATVTDINAGIAALRDITVTSDPLLPNWGFIVDEQPGDGHASLDQVLHLMLDAIYDPIFGSSLPAHTEAELCLGSLDFCGGEGNGSGDINTTTLWFELYAEGAIPAAESPLGVDIPYRLTIRGQGTPDGETAAPTAESTAGLHVWPNPSQASVAFAFATPAPATVAIYDVAGRHIISLRGTGRLEWDGRDAAGQRVGAGVYLARYRCTDAAGTAKILMLR